MTPKERAAMQQALEVIELMYEWLNAGTPSYVDESKEEAITALREALDHFRDATKMVQEPVATDLMDMLRLIETIKYLRGIAERGLGREIREDETIEQFVLGYVKQLESTQPVKQEPVLRYAHIKCPVCDVENPGIHKCAAPVRTKDLTDDEIWEAVKDCPVDSRIEAARAGIAADREKNK